LVSSFEFQVLDIQDSLTALSLWQYFVFALSVQRSAFCVLPYSVYAYGLKLTAVFAFGFQRLSPLTNHHSPLTNKKAIPPKQNGLRKIKH
jgi:hypothetical protein